MDGVRTAGVGDVAGMVALSERYRRRLETYQPVFWRRAPDAGQVARCDGARLRALSACEQPGACRLHERRGCGFVL